MKNKEILQKLESTILMLTAHPNFEERSEFADRVNDLEEIKEELTQKLEKIDVDFLLKQGFKKKELKNGGFAYDKKISNYLSFYIHELDNFGWNCGLYSTSDYDINIGDFVYQKELIEFINILKDKSQQKYIEL